MSCDVDGLGFTQGQLSVGSVRVCHLSILPHHYTMYRALIPQLTDTTASSRLQEHNYEDDKDNRPHHHKGGVAVV